MSEREDYVPDVAGAWRSPEGWTLTLVRSRESLTRFQSFVLSFRTEHDLTMPYWREGSLSVRRSDPEFALLPEPLRRCPGLVLPDPWEAWETHTGGPMTHPRSTHQSLTYAQELLFKLRRTLRTPHHKGHPMVVGHGVDEDSVIVDAGWLHGMKALIADPDGIAKNEGRKA